MPGLVELAYTTGGGVIGAALTNYVAGVPRRVADFAAGAHERLLDCALMLIIDRRIGGVLGAPGESGPASR